MKPLDEVLWRPVSDSWLAVKEKDFWRRYEDEVSDLEDLIWAFRLLPDGSSVYELFCGYAVHEYKNKYSLYLTKTLADERDYIKAWAMFTRGTWVERCPKEPGWYAVRDREGRLRFRELKSADGRVVDVSGGLVPVGRISTWTGAWWSERVPSLPGSYI